MPLTLADVRRGGKQKLIDAFEATDKEASALAELVQASSSKAELMERAAAKRRKASGKPDFKSDERYERLLPAFDVSSVAELEELRLDAFRQKASELLFAKRGVERALGSFKSYQDAIDTILDNGLESHRTEGGILRGAGPRLRAQIRHRSDRPVPQHVRRIPPGDAHRAVDRQLRRRRWHRQRVLWRARLRQDY